MDPFGHNRQTSHVQKCQLDSSSTCSASPPPSYHHLYQHVQQRERHRHHHHDTQRRRRQQQQQQSAVTVIYPSYLLNTTTDYDDDDDDVFEENDDSRYNSPLHRSSTAVTVQIYPERVVLNGLQAVSFQPPLPTTASSANVQPLMTTDNYFDHNSVDAEAATETTLPSFYEEHFSCSPPPILILGVSLIQCILFGVLNSLDSLPSAARVPCIYDNLALSWHNWLRQPWRLVTYALLHNDLWHLLFTVGSQAVLGVCLELVHTWRVLAVYCAGILGGAVGYLLFSYSKYYYLYYYNDDDDAAQLLSDCDIKQYLAMLPEAIIIGASSGCYALLACQFVNFALNYRCMVMAWVQLAALLIYALIEIVAQVVYNQPPPTRPPMETDVTVMNIRPDDDLNKIYPFQPPGDRQMRPDLAARTSSVIVRPGVLLNRDALWMLDEFDDNAKTYNLAYRALLESHRFASNAILNESTACHVFGALAGLLASFLLLKRIGASGKGAALNLASSYRRPFSARAHVVRSDI